MAAPVCAEWQMTLNPGLKRALSGPREHLKEKLYGWREEIESNAVEMYRVRLAGFVDSKVQIVQAGKIAAGESGVNAVLNNLTIK